MKLGDDEIRNGDMHAVAVHTILKELLFGTYRPQLWLQKRSIGMKYLLSSILIKSLSPSCLGRSMYYFVCATCKVTKHVTNLYE